MTQATKPSAALSAARELLPMRAAIYDQAATEILWAEIIEKAYRDCETGVAELSELLEAVKAVMAQLDFSGQIDYLDASTYKRLEQARAKCELLEQVGRKP